MKPCVLCKAIKQSGNHKCPVKNNIVNNSLKSVGKPENTNQNPFIKISQNLEKPNIQNFTYKVPTPKAHNEYKGFILESKDDEDIKTDENAYLLYDAMELLSKNQEFCDGIFSHACEKGCIQCTINSQIEGKSFKKAQRIYDEICNIYGKNIALIDFVNCLNIFLNCLHHIRIREFSDKKCNYECISHKNFFLDVHQQVVCECNQTRNNYLSLNTFTIPINIFNSATASIREILFENSKVRIPLCPSHHFCVKNNSCITTQILNASGWILFELKYENPNSHVDLCGFEDFFIDNLHAHYYLTSLVFKDNLKYCMLFRCHLGWEYKEKNLVLNSASELNLFFNVNRLKPCLIVYSTKR
ncbi:hypothetical protein SteCoe_6440 [Stentor coeruleus]|uniref:Uncharacterized protein n=1 Tax=Stentor coeruleus TaxID=5963 RepID=A0A1R2CPZ7_9CILI|nr:hypothetical protein SteCoe_6440 [Stentor coeruleus]